MDCAVTPLKTLMGFSVHLNVQLKFYNLPFNINTLCKFGIVSTLYPVFTLNTSADKYFVYYYLNYGKEMQKFALIQKQGGSRTYMYLNKLRKLRFIVPLLSEQEKISTTLLLLDKLISLQQRKLDLLKQLKKGFLQKMFADKDSKRPILRFEGFNDDWEGRKLENSADYIRGSFPQPYGNKEWYGGTNAKPFVQVVDVNTNMRLNKKTKEQISVLAQPKSRFVPSGSIVVTLQGSIGRVAITQYDSYVDRTLLIFTKYKVPFGPRIKSVQVK